MIYYNSYKSNKMSNPEQPFYAPFLEKEILDEITIPNYYDIEKAKKAHDKYGFYIILNCLAPNKKKSDKWLEFDKTYITNNTYDYYDCESASKDLLNALIDTIIKENIQNDTLKKIYQILIDDKKSIIDRIKSFPKSSLPGLATKGFLSLYNFPQTEFSWRLRLNERIRYHYAMMHETPYDDLCVSLDVPFLTPSMSDGKPCAGWQHIDQNTKLQEGKTNMGSALSLQGILYVWDCTKEGTSQTVLLPASHNDESLRLLHGINPEQYNEFGHGLYIRDTDQDTQKYLLNAWKTKARRIPVPAGALLVFDSRIIHQGFQDGYRFAQTICWEPKINRLKDAYIRKLQAIYGGIATTHWASMGVHHGVSFMPSYGSNNKFEKRNINNFALNDGNDTPDGEKKYIMKTITKLSSKQLEKLIKPEILEII